MCEGGLDRVFVGKEIAMGRENKKPEILPLNWGLGRLIRSRIGLGAENGA
jgi:hypothetical protein